MPSLPGGRRDTPERATVRADSTCSFDFRLKHRAPLICTTIMSGTPVRARLQSAAQLVARHHPGDQLLAAVHSAAWQRQPARGSPGADPSPSTSGREHQRSWVLYELSRYRRADRATSLRSLSGAHSLRRGTHASTHMPPHDTALFSSRAGAGPTITATEQAAEESHHQVRGMQRPSGAQQATIATKTPVSIPPPSFLSHPTGRTAHPRMARPCRTCDAPPCLSCGASAAGKMPLQQLRQPPPHPRLAVASANCHPPLPRPTPRHQPLQEASTSADAASAAADAHGGESPSVLSQAAALVDSDRLHRRFRRREPTFEVVEFYPDGNAVELMRPRTASELGLHPRDLGLFAPLSRLAAPQVRARHERRRGGAVR